MWPAVDMLPSVIHRQWSRARPDLLPAPLTTRLVSFAQGSILLCSSSSKPDWELNSGLPTLARHRGHLQGEFACLFVFCRF